MNENTIRTGPGICTILFIIFLVLKLTGNIDWSWWVVTSPYWIPLLLVIAIILIIIIVISIQELIKTITERI